MGESAYRTWLKNKEGERADKKAFVEGPLRASIVEAFSEVVDVTYHAGADEIVTIHRKRGEPLLEVLVNLDSKREVFKDVAKALIRAE